MEIPEFGQHADAVPEVFRTVLGCTEEEIQWMFTQGFNLAQNIVGNLEEWMRTYGQNSIFGLVAARIATQMVAQHVSERLDAELANVLENHQEDIGGA